MTWAQFTDGVLLQLTAAFGALVVAQSRDMAYELGRLRATLDDGKGGTRETAGKHLVVWQKRGGRWLVSAESISPDHP